MNFPNFIKVWQYRGFILSNVKREFRIKYQNSILGAAWNVINPLSMIFVYTVIFSEIMRSKLPNMDGHFSYSIYLCSGILTWGLFLEIITKSQNVFISNANLIKKINFPRLCLPITVVANALLNFSIVFGLFMIFLIFTGNFPGIVFLAIIPVLIILIMFAIGLGITLGLMNVFFRDIGQMLGIILQFWFWLTPIVYPVNIVPEKLKVFLDCNPMFGVIDAFHMILVMQQWPDWSRLLPCLLLGILFCIYGLNLFRKHSSEMVDEL